MTKSPSSTAKPRKAKRNDALYDWWSLVHLSSGIGFGWIMSPFWAMVILVLWEPLENFVLSPIFAKYGITFGYETIRNSLSDIFFDTIGVLLATYVLSKLIAPPFHLF
jgi:hypothetical protein